MNKKLYLYLITSVLVFIIYACAGSTRQKSTVSPFPEGKEYFTLLTVYISPDTITNVGSDVIVSYKQNMPYEEEKVIPVILIEVNNSQTKTSIVTGVEIKSDSGKFEFPVSNDRWGHFSGSGTIYIYLEKPSKIDLMKMRFDDKTERVSNVISVYTHFK